MLVSVEAAAAAVDGERQNPQDYTSSLLFSSAMGKGKT